MRDRNRTQWSILILRTGMLIAFTGCSEDAAAPSDKADAAVALTDVGPTSKSDAIGSPPKMGGPACGFAAAAFCDTFDGPSANQGRARELDATYWSGARNHPQLATSNDGRSIGIGMAVIPPCRNGISDQVWTANDTLICDPNADVPSNHLLIAAAAQHYGQNGYRVRQPFDFAGRTGRIVFDGSIDDLGGLFGWISLAITEDPIALPGYAIYNNDEGTIIPKNALEIHFNGDAGLGKMNSAVHAFQNFVDTLYVPPDGVYTTYQKNKMNRFEILVSNGQVEVHISPLSMDGKTFAAPSYVFQAPVELPFTRGWVQLSVHNHAPLKYSGPGKDQGQDVVIDASVAHIDNFGFDGPVISQWREYEVPDSLVKFNGDIFAVPDDPYNPDKTGYDVGYNVSDSKSPVAQPFISKEWIRRM